MKMLFDFSLLIGFAVGLASWSAGTGLIAFVAAFGIMNAIAFLKLLFEG